MDGSREGQQCKGRYGSEQSWSYGSVNSKGIWKKWGKQYSYELRKYYENNESKKILQKYIDKLYNIKFFPVTDMNDDKYHTCYNVMSLLYRADSDKFLKYCDEIECDRMARYRLEKLVEKIVRNYWIKK